MTESTCKDKMALVEKLGVHLEKREQLAPMAARVLSYIILNGKQGTTFESMVTGLCVSKSTVSTHLNHLQDLNKIKYFTKTGDRKKYFIINRNIMFQHIDKMVQAWQDERKLHLEIKTYKATINKSLIDEKEEKFDLEFHSDYIRYVDGAISSIEELRAKLIKDQFDHKLRK